ncbi:DUF4143 domain-containing protein [Candidatus Parcubacteria bacterium]|nr:DUF4143 domain-containing protein [Candidatus Parcubacteria bacterium]
MSQPTANKFLQYAQEVFLVQAVNYFSYSFTKQKAGPCKIYTIDSGLYNAVSFKFSENLGRIFENLVYLEFRRKQKEIFYWHGRNEVDFIIRKGVKIDKIINACWELNEGNKQREIAGLVEAMDEFKLKKSEIITIGYEEDIKINNKKIQIKYFFNEM